MKNSCDLHLSGAAVINQILLKIDSSHGTDGMHEAGKTNILGIGVLCPETTHSVCSISGAFS